jgi:hypothetical protein
MIARAESNPRARRTRTVAFGFAYSVTKESKSRNGRFRSGVGPKDARLEKSSLDSIPSKRVQQYAR